MSLGVRVYVSVSVPVLPALSSPFQLVSGQCLVLAVLVSLVLVFSRGFVLVFSIVSSFVRALVSLFCLVHVHLSLVCVHACMLPRLSLAFLDCVVPIVVLVGRADILSMRSRWFCRLCVNLPHPVADTSGFAWVACVAREI